MIHLYYGEGKGKTTSAMGLALRAAGRGQGVVVAQFLKGADSGERRALALLPQVVLLPLPDQVKFTFHMSPEERLAEGARNLALLSQADELARSGLYSLVVLDEVCAALSSGLLPLDPVLTLLDRPGPELVLTGRDPHPALLLRADYVTCFHKIRHPYDQGVQARPGIEF